MKLHFIRQNCHFILLTQPKSMTMGWIFDSFSATGSDITPRIFSSTDLDPKGVSTRADNIRHFENNRIFVPGTSVSRTAGQ